MHAPTDNVINVKRKHDVLLSPLTNIFRSSIAVAFAITSNNADIAPGSVIAGKPLAIYWGSKGDVSK